MINLTPEEKVKVQEKKKSERDLPKYYDAQLRTEIPITRDFEAFLILSTEELKTKALEWINRVEKLQNKKQARDRLTEIVVLQAVKNTETRMTVLEEKMEGYNGFRSQFQLMTDFSSVKEVNTFLQDLQRIIPEMSKERERAFFDQTVAVVEDNENKRIRGEINSENLTQLQSWSNVISSYF